ncbi:MAG: hypothetical protein K1X89_31190 [Myxococcaceae bacterium]|nr:hypothetical protein [Myxococcaceae bacterium]
MTRALALSAALLVPLAALAQEAVVPVQADVVLGTDKVAKDLTPPMKAMQAALAKKKRYGTLQLLSSQVLKVSKKSLALALPNQKSAELSLESLEAGVATVRVKVPPADTTSKLGAEGSLYVHAGKHETGDLWLVLSRPKG